MVDESTIADHAHRLIGTLERLDELEPALVDVAGVIASAFSGGGKLLTAGNGGSAAEAQNLSSEFVGRLAPARERPPLPAVSLHTDASVVTAIANDYGYEEVFARGLQAIGRQGDVLVVFSTSGTSANLVAAVEVAARLGVVTLGFLGGTPRTLHERCDHVLAVPSDDGQVVQECHAVLVHVLVEQVEDRLGLVG